MGLIFTFVMTYGGSVAALYRPYWGFLIYVCFGIIRPSDLWYWSVEAGNHSRILAIALIVGWAIHSFGDWNLGRARPAAVALIIFIVWSAISACFAVSDFYAWRWVENQTKITLPILIGLTLIDSIPKLKQLAWVVLVSHGFIAYEFNMAYFSGFNRLQELGFGSLDNNCVGIGFVTCCGLGGFMAMSAIPLWQRAVAVICMAFMVHAILFSMSRGAMLGLIVLAVTSFILMPKRPVHIILLLVAIGLTLAFTGSSVMERFVSSFADKGQRDESSDSRILMWSICIEKTLENPILGLGPHHFPVYAQSFGLTPRKEAHTTWLQLAAELGLPGVCSLLFFYTSTMLGLLPLTRQSRPVPDPFIRDIARMVIASTVGFLFTAQFVTLPGLEAPYYVVMLGLGALRILSAHEANPGPAANAPGVDPLAYSESVKGSGLHHSFGTPVKWG